jgi:HSP20 family molecular chaperone IbpA
MNLGWHGFDRDPLIEPSTVRWTVRENDEHVRAVADVPAVVPREELGYVATDSGVGLFIETPDHLQATVCFPATVEPTPVSVSYNNAIVEIVFARATPVLE